MHSKQKVWNVPHDNVHLHQLLTFEHCWSISAGSCLATILMALIFFEQVPPVYLCEELVMITVVQQ
jgi:hypothetical protein